MDINYELYKVFFYVATTLSFSEAMKDVISCDKLWGGANDL